MGPRPSSFLVWGSGGHGRVVGELVRAAGHRLAGYIDKDQEKIGTAVEPLGVPVMHLQEEFVVSIHESGRYPDGCDACAFGIGDNVLRQACLRDLEGFSVPALVHPDAAMSASASIDRGSVVFPGAVVNTGARIGQVVIVNSGAIIEHDCVLEDAVHVSPGATLCGGVRVGERTWIGAGATVIHGISVGKDSVVGAGSTVIQDVPDECTVVGTPARSIRGPDR